jgi:hypothetical protein
MYNEVKEELKVPKRVFIVPYRNRVQHKFFFSKYMSFILEDSDDYEIYFSHQCDARTFNRGGVKDIGFLAIRNKYPQHYKDITFIFNDIDTIPFNKIFDYQTNHGIVKHYYGFKYALGGIIVMKGADFERINGFPCFWGWGMEDNALQKRCDRAGLKVDRSVFYNIGSPEILQLFDGISRIISKKDPWRGEHDNGIDGLKTITQLKYSIDEKSENPNDNIFSVHNSRIFFINISTFLTHIPFGSEEYYNYDLREPKRKIINPDKIKETKKTVVSTNDWSNIPYYPTTREKRENVAKYLMSMGKPVPETLIKQIEDDKRKEVEQDFFNNFNVSNQENSDEEQIVSSEELLEQYQQQQQPQQYHQYQQPYPHQYQQPYPRQYQQQRRQPIRPPPNKYSPQYAAYVGVKPRAQASARIGLGGAF